MTRICCLLLCLLFAVFAAAQTFMGAGGKIPDDGTGIAFDISVALPATVLDTQIFGLESVCITASHTWDSDLSFSLRAPDGTLIALFSGIGGDQDGFQNTCLSNNANASIFSAAFPFTGEFRPFGEMGRANNGQNPNGTWQLLILDTYAFADEGELLNWSITFGPNPCVPFPFASSDLPIVRLETGGKFIPNEPKVEARLRIIDNGPGQRNFADQPDAAFEGAVGVELRGHSSQSFPKKTYGIETRDSAGKAIEVSLLGLPETSDFVLSANFSDKTLMRNALSYEVFHDMGGYASRTRFCELLLDGNYQGIYILTERIKRGKERVDIPKLSPADTAGVDITGGYILALDWQDGDTGWPSQFEQSNHPRHPLFLHKYPPFEAMHPKQVDYIRGFVDSFEVALHGPEFQDPFVGWRRFADEASFMDYFFLDELSKNVDGYRLSTYFFKQRDDRGGKLRMGPPWDFDLAWNNADYCENFLPSDWAFDLNYVCLDAGVPFWWEKLVREDTLFQQNAACRWQSLRAGALSRTTLYAKVDSMAALLSEAQARNFAFWPILGVYVWPNPAPIPTSYAGEIQKLKTWILRRLNWLDATINKWTPTLDAAFSVTPQSAFSWQFSAASAGQNLVFAWDFGDGTTSNEAAPQHQFPGTGTYTVRLSVGTLFGCSEVSQQVLYIVNASAGEALAGALRIFPNPVRRETQLDWPKALAGSCSLRVHNALGICVLSQIACPDGGKFALDLSDLPAGMYWVELLGAEGTWVGRVEKVAP